MSYGSWQSERLARRRQQMMAQAKLRRASWMSSRISQRTRGRRNQCNRAIACPYLKEEFEMRLAALRGGGDAPTLATPR